MFEEIIKKYSLDLEEYPNEDYLTSDYASDRYYSMTSIELITKELDFGYDPIYFKDYGLPEEEWEEQAKIVLTLFIREQLGMENH